MPTDEEAQTAQATNAAGAKTAAGAATAPAATGIDGFFETAWDDFKAKALKVEAVVKADLKIAGQDLAVAAESVKQEAVTDLGKLVNTLTPFATAAAQEVEGLAASGDILDSEKRSTLVTKVAGQAQLAGYDLKTEGVSAAINLVVELAVNFFKLITGQSLGAPTN